MDSAVLVEDKLTTNRFLYDSLNNLLYSNNSFICHDFQYKGLLSNKESFFDSNQNIIQEIEYDYDTIINQFIPSKNTYLRYQDVNNDVYKTDSIFDWDTNNSVWKYTGKTVYHYNQFDEYSAVYYYDSSSFLSFKYEYDYYNDSLVSNILLTQFWKDYYDPSIINSFFNKYEYTYDNNNRLILYSTKSTDDTLSNNWDLYQKTEVQYSQLNTIWTRLLKDNQNNWYNYYQWRYEYDNRTNLIKYTELLYDTLTPWVNQYQVEQSFDYNDSIISQAAYDSYDKSNNRWIGNEKFFATYDADGNHLTTYHYLWDTVSSDWTGLYKDQYFYDYSFQLNDLLYPDGFMNYFKSTNQLKLIENHESFWDKSLNDWVYTRKWDFYYTSFQYASIKDEVKDYNTVSVYPNPSGDFILFETKSQIESILEIHNSIGEIVYKGVLVNKAKIDLSTLENGVYIYKIKTHNRINQGKILKQ